MFSEIIITLLVMSISAQSSSLLSSLCVIPLSVVVIMLSNSVNSYSGIVSILYIMVFVGGLLVLLVSVASLAHQEQSFNLPKSWFFICCLLMSPFITSMSMEVSVETTSQFASWFIMKGSLINLVVVLLLLALMVLTKLIFSFKGMIRGL